MTRRSARRPWQWVLILPLLVVGFGLVLAMSKLAQPRVDPHRLRAQAMAAVQAQRFDEAEAALDRLRLKTAFDWMLLSKIHKERGRAEAALADLAHVPDSDPLAPLARYSEGLIELNTRHRAPAAEAALLRAVALDPKRMILARRELINLYILLSMTTEHGLQFRVLEEMGQVTSDDVYQVCVITRPYFERQRIIDRLKQFLRADPEDRRSRFALAEALRKHNVLDEAEQTLSYLPESNPQARAIRVRLALDRGEVRAAEKLLAAGSDDDPELAPLRGKLALAQRDTKSAVRYFKIAFAAHPNRRDTLLGLGQALRLLGDPSAAAPCLKAAADLDTLELLIQNLVAPGATTDPKMLHKLGAACEALRRYPEARAWYKLSLTQDPSSSETRHALLRLEQPRSDRGTNDTTSRTAG